MNIPHFLRCLAVLFTAGVSFALVGCESATGSSSAPYDPIVGVWTWTPRDHQVTVRRGGVATSSYGGRATWQKISSNTYQFRWGSRFADTLTLSDDANTLTGRNQYGPQPNAFTRVGSTYVQPTEAENSYSSEGSSEQVLTKQAMVGTWIMSSKDYSITLNFRSNGTSTRTFREIPIFLEPSTWPGTWKIEGRVLTVIEAGDPSIRTDRGTLYSYEVLEFTNSVLKVREQSTNEVSVYTRQ